MTEKDSPENLRSQGNLLFRHCHNEQTRSV